LAETQLKKNGMKCELLTISCMNNNKLIKGVFKDFYDITAHYSLDDPRKLMQSLDNFIPSY